MTDTPVTCVRRRTKNVLGPLTGRNTDDFGLWAYWCRNGTGWRPEPCVHSKYHRGASMAKTKKPRRRRTARPIPEVSAEFRAEIEKLGRPR